MVAPRLAETDDIGRENVALRRLVAVYRHLSSLAVQDDGIEAVTELIAERVDATVAVVDDKLTVLAAASPTSSTDEAARLVGERMVHPRLAQVLGVAGRTRRALRLPDVEEAGPVIVAPILVGDQVPAYLMTLDDAAERTGEDLRLLLTEHAATICGVILGRERVVAAAATQVRYDLVEGLLSGTGGDAEEVLRWARHLGYDTERDHRVICLVYDNDEPGSGGESAELERRVASAVERFFTTHAPEAITAVRDAEVVVVLGEPDPEAPRAERLARDCLRRMRELFRTVAVTAGIGAVCRPPTEIARSYGEARRTVEVTRRMGRTGVAVAFEDLGIHRLLLQVADPEQLREFAREVFGGLTAGGRGNAADYLTTLGCYFRANNSPQRASQVLHVHPNTVTYRVRRVEELTSLDFGSYRDRLLAQVALEILDAVGEGR
ncbi:sugar diacid utilization regulator [Saccharomonospora amisosensis]|uniref:Sugar diacid utilization regulator n=1 Tax=Saccharomonospora amisosensis TaxID=1128677 RepID=A0A7X5URD1_9PSEU|nr:helix-turn-helix domain-containing protein [Saccharomonospora amisosensis]NIJ12329.1 sugar diacid utilization regulator [Saccharomonospora amisosensis]